MTNSYPTGLPQAQNFDARSTAEQLEQNPGDDPSWVDGPVLAMSAAWTPIQLCIGGTAAFRSNAAEYLPQEPREEDDAWQRRVYHATMAPFLTRIVDQAAGLIVRRPVQLTGEDGVSPAGEFWEEFADNVDGQGTSLNDYARELVRSALLFGHTATLVDFPATEAAPNLAAERAMNLRPYFIHTEAPQILGWRKESALPMAPVSQIRLDEFVSEPMGMFGDREVRQIRVLMPGAWQLYRQDSGSSTGWAIHAEGTTSLDRLPLVPMYAAKVGDWVSRPPMLPIAHLNINHAQREADLTHSLHVAALPILVLKGFDDQGEPIGLSANSAILLPPDGDAKYVEPASSAFDSQRQRIKDLEDQIAALSVSTLFMQKAVAETAESKRLSRTDSDSLLVAVSRNLEDSLQNMFDVAAEYLGIEPPLVSIDKDFDLQSLEPGQVDQYLKLWVQNAITQETLLQALVKGEVFPELDIESEVEQTAEASARGLPQLVASDPPPGATTQQEAPEISAAREQAMVRLAGLMPTEN